MQSSDGIYDPFKCIVAFVKSSVRESYQIWLDGECVCAGGESQVGSVCASLCKSSL